MGLPAILIPKIDLPADHQILNAREVEKIGGARVLYEEISGQGKEREIFLAADAFFNTIQELLGRARASWPRCARTCWPWKSRTAPPSSSKAVEAIIGKKDRAREKEIRGFLPAGAGG